MKLYVQGRAHGDVSIDIAEPQTIGLFLFFFFFFSFLFFGIKVPKNKKVNFKNSTIDAPFKRRTASPPPISPPHFLLELTPSSPESPSISAVSISLSPNLSSSPQSPCPLPKRITDSPTLLTLRPLRRPSRQFRTPPAFHQRGNASPPSVPWTPPSTSLASPPSPPSIVINPSEIPEIPFEDPVKTRTSPHRNNLFASRTGNLSVRGFSQKISRPRSPSSIPSASSPSSSFRHTPLRSPSPTRNSIAYFLSPPSKPKKSRSSQSPISSYKKSSRSSPVSHGQVKTPSPVSSSQFQYSQSPPSSYSSSSSPSSRIPTRSRSHQHNSIIRHPPLSPPSHSPSSSPSPPSSPPSPPSSPNSEEKARLSFELPAQSNISNFYLRAVEAFTSPRQKNSGGENSPSPKQKPRQKTPGENSPSPKQRPMVSRPIVTSRQLSPRQISPARQQHPSSPIVVSRPHFVGKSKFFFSFFFLMIFDF